MFTVIGGLLSTIEESRSCLLSNGDRSQSELTSSFHQNTVGGR
jgi:hypothetical protein